MNRETIKNELRSLISELFKEKSFDMGLGEYSI